MGSAATFQRGEAAGERIMTPKQAVVGHQGHTLALAEFAALTEEVRKADARAGVEALAGDRAVWPLMRAFAEALAIEAEALAATGSRAGAQDAARASAALWADFLGAVGPLEGFLADTLAVEAETASRTLGGALG